ncbi:MAG: prepilin-type N-terminal cleavage/methylation domain-containing protein [Patescibacteria group bacterium]|jgi:prepilin-type N-terminal cleavage/methylation domain-containing protein
MKKYNSGFTLVEIVIAIGIIGILSGILVTIINPESKRNQTRDAVRMNQLQELASGLETMRLAEGRYPATTAAAVTEEYLVNWPGDYIYTPGSNTMSVYVPSAADSSKVFMYNSNVGKIQICNATTLDNCIDL